MNLENFCQEFEQERALVSSLATDELCSIITRVVLRILGLDVSIIMLYDIVNWDMVGIAGMGVSEEIVNIRLPANEWPFSELLEGRDQYLIEVDKDKNFVSKINPQWNSGFLLLLPLKDEHRLIGTLILYRKDFSGPFDDKIGSFFRPICSHIAFLINTQQSASLIRWDRRSGRLADQIKQTVELREQTEKIRLRIEQSAELISKTKDKVKIREEAKKLRKESLALEKNVEILRSQIVTLEAQVGDIEKLIFQAKERDKLITERDKLIKELEQLREQIKSSSQLLEQARRIEELVEKKNELSLLYDIAKEAPSFNEISSLLDNVLERIHPFFKYELGAYLISEGGRTFSKVKPMIPVTQRTLETIAEGIGDELRLMGLNMKIDLLAHCPSILSESDKEIQESHSLLTAPLFDQEEIIGVLSISSSEPEAFALSKKRIFDLLSSHLSLAIAKIKLLKETQQELKKVQTKLVRSSKMAAMGEITSKVSHELKGPVGRIIMAISSMKRLSTPSPEKLNEYIDILERASHQTNEIIKNILNFSRSVSLELKLVNVNKLIEEAVLLVEHELERSRVQLKYRLEKNLPPILADPARLEEVFTNLITNAAQAMPRGGDLTIRSLPSPDALGFIQIEFQDTGSGMSQQVKDRLFELFFTTKSNGLGLGLAISKEIVEKHKGQIRIESKEGMGSTFTVLLPR
ncbi:TPA: hypothetical protein DCX15_03440 [bacterium]|nr:hypothetical protein [bacterium]